MLNQPSGLPPPRAAVPGFPFEPFFLIAIAGQALLAVGIVLLILTFFPTTNPILIAGLTLLGAALLQPVRLRLQDHLSSRSGLRQRTVAEWLETFQELTASSSDSERGWRAVIAIVRAALAPNPMYEFRFHPSDGRFYSPSTDAFFSTTGRLAATLSQNSSVYPIESIEADPEEMARLQEIHGVILLALSGKSGMEGFLILGNSHGMDTRYDEKDRQLLDRLADAFHAMPAWEEPDWQQLSGAAREIQSEVLYCEWLQALISQWIPSRSFRIARMDRNQRLLAYIFFFQDGHRRTEMEGPAFPWESDLCSTVIPTGMAFFSDSSVSVCHERNLPIREPDCAWGGLPLGPSAQTLGILVVSRDLPFSEAERILLKRYADWAGPNFERILWQEQSARSTSQMAAMRRMARRLFLRTEMDPILQTLLEGGCELAGAQSAAIFFPAREGTWEARKAIGAVSRLDIPISDAFTSAARMPVPTRVERVKEDNTLRELFPLAECAFVLPLHRQEHTTAVIAIANPTYASPFPREEDDLWSAFATLAILALENANFAAQTDPMLSGVVEELVSLQRLDQELNAADDVATVFTIALDWAMRRTEASAGFAFAPQGAELEVLAARGYPSDIDPGLACDLVMLQGAMRGGESVLFQRDASGEYPGALPGAATAFLLPVFRADQPLGALCLETNEEGAFSSATMDILTRMAVHTATALAHAQLHADVLQANQAKSEFISFVAHELKTPMTSIRGYTDLLAQGAVGPVNSSQANFLTTIRTNADRLASLVSDLNDISRIESGRLRLEFSQCSLSSAIEEVMESLRSQIDAKEQTLTMEISAHLPPIWADRDRLIQVLTNLISNAHKYTPAGGFLHITAERTSNRWDETGASDVIHIAIQDTGLGISPQDQKGIFQKFFRAEDRSVRDLPGTGLGLHITRNLVELQGGRIWFESELRKGSTFHFTIPVASI